TMVGGDPFFTLGGLDFPGTNVPVVLIRLKSTVAGNAQFFWGNELGGPIQSRSIIFFVPSSAGLNWYALDMTTNTEWAGHTIHELRLDPAGSSGTVTIDALIGSDGDFDKDGIPDRWEIVNRLDPS